MTLTDLLPVRFSIFSRPVRAPKHRASDEVGRLQHKLAGAELLMAGYRVQLEDLHADHAETIARIDERHAEIVEGLERQLAALQARLDIACKAETAVTRTQELSLDEIRKHCVIPLGQAPFASVGPVPETLLRT